MKICWFSNILFSQMVKHPFFRKMIRSIFFIFIHVLVLIQIRTVNAGKQPPNITVSMNKIVVLPRSHLPANDIVFDISFLNNINFNKCADALLCIEWGDQASFRVQPFEKDDKCYEYSFKTIINYPLKAEFNLRGLYVYGGPEMDNQSWPIGSQSLNDTPYVSHEKDAQAVLESYWLDSKGQYVYVYDEVPLFVTQNSTLLVLTAKREPPYLRPNNETLMKFVVCNLNDPRTAQLHAVNNFLHKPTTVPDFTMVKWPIWSTWAKYKVNISQKTVLEFAENITRHHFPNSQLEIDDAWETCYGSLTVDPKKFPDMKDLVNKLKSKGYRVTIWVHPFVNEDCQPFFNATLKEGYFVRNTSGVLTNWWHGIAGQIDFTNPKAASWWSNRLTNLLNETGIDSFKFDAGETSWCPQPPIFHYMGKDYPETITKAYINVTSKFGPMVEVRSARGTQQYSPFVRMIDRETTWKGRLSLQTLIPSLLLINILGYPFVLPDMIGGNAYGNDVVTDEMFIRWLQINVFMPSLQFSYPPWDFKSNVVEISKKFVDLHEKYAEKIYELMKESTKLGTPVNLPIWWIDPTDEVALGIGSEFLLGEDILVAPIIEANTTNRNIYLPKGQWKDENHPTSATINGPIWLENYEAKLDTLPYFTRVNDDHSSCTLFSSSLFLIVSLLVPALFGCLISQ